MSTPLRARATPPSPSSHQATVRGWLSRIWREFTPDERVDGPLARHFRARQIQALLGLLPLVAVGNAVNTVALSWVFWGLLPHAPLAFWCVSMVMSMAVAGFWWRSLIVEQPRPHAPRIAIYVIVVHAVVFALAWSLVPIWLFPLADRTGALLIASVTVGSICAGAFMLSAVAQAAACYVLVLSAGSVIGLWRSDYAQPGVSFTLLLVYMVVMIAVACASGRVFLARLRAEGETERQKQLIDLLLKDFEENASDWLWETSSTGHLRHVSNRLSQSFGLPTKAIQGRPFTELLAEMLPPDDDEATAAWTKLNTCIRMGQPFRDLELVVEVGHELRCWSMSAKPLHDEHGRAAGWRGVGSDITQARRAHDELARLANVDALTGLANRHRFSVELQRVAHDASRADAPCALFYLDLDNFKQINDTLGHTVGDQLLKRVGARLKACVGEGDILARLGGDEFAVLSWHHTRSDQASALAHRMLSLLGEPCQLDDVLVEIKASVGIALAPQDGRDPNALLQCADLALYAAKGAGRGIHRFFEPSMAEHARARVRLQHELGHALVTQQFALHFQPQVDLSTGLTIGFEALVRWHHSDRGLISPGEFIPVAEETGQIVPLGSWVLREACRQAAAWPLPLRVAVNLSAVQFRSSSVIDLVDEALRDSGLPPERLELEITETALIDDHDAAETTLSALRARGVRVALDDFGTGYSSLAYLKRFPMDKLKIDGMFVRGLANNPDAQAVVTAILGLARALHLGTTAEGVETPEQLVLLRALGCDDIQGYLVAKPMPGDQVSGFLARPPFELA